MLVLLLIIFRISTFLSNNLTIARSPIVHTVFTQSSLHNVLLNIVPFPCFQGPVEFTEDFGRKGGNIFIVQLKGLRHCNVKQ